MQCYKILLECQRLNDGCFAPYVVHAKSAEVAKEIAINYAINESLKVVVVEEIIEIVCEHDEQKKEQVVEVYGKSFFEES